METIEDIVREMRKRFEPYSKSDSNDARYVAYLGYAEFADRIEAAVKREVAVAKMETTTKESLVVGNMAKAQEVLMALANVDLPEPEEYPAEYGGGVVPDENIWLFYLRQMKDKAQSALATPPRNCDIMSLDKARTVWFMKEIMPRLDGKLPLGKEIPFDEWFVSQYEEGKSK